MSLGLTWGPVEGSEIAAIEAALEGGRRVYVMPYARVEEEGASYVLATLATDPDRAVVLVRAGTRLLQLSGPEADRILKIVDQDQDPVGGDHE